MPSLKATLLAATFLSLTFPTSDLQALPMSGALQLDQSVESSLVNKVAVFPHDARKELRDDSAPWRAIGRLEIPDGTSCTASLIGPNLVLTNAHCVADTKSKRILPGNYLFKAQYRRGKFEGVSSVKQIITGGYRISHNSRKGDWALLVLRKRLGDELGWLGMAEFETSDLLTITDHYRLYMAGYAYDKSQSEIPVWQSNCSFHNEYFSQKTILTHDCSTTSGASGSPMFIFQKNQEGKSQAVIVALHSGNQFAFDKDVAENGKMVPFTDENANLAVHASEFIETVRKLRAQED